MAVLALGYDLMDSGARQTRAMLIALIVVLVADGIIIGGAVVAALFLLTSSLSG